MAIPAFIIVFISGLGNYSTYGYWITGLSQELFPLLMVMFFNISIMHLPRRWTLVSRRSEVLLFTIVGSRIYVLAVFVMTAELLPGMSTAQVQEPLHWVYALRYSKCIDLLVPFYYGRKTYRAPLRAHFKYRSVRFYGDGRFRVRYQR